MLRASECRAKIEYLDKLLVVKEEIPAEEVHMRYHWQSLRNAYERELKKAIAREVQNANRN